MQTLKSPWKLPPTSICLSEIFRSIYPQQISREKNLRQMTLIMNAYAYWKEIYQEIKKKWSLIQTSLTIYFKKA